jgi:hypothetical protein
LSAPVHAARGAFAALLAKEIIPNLQPVATSSSGLEFRSFSPVASQSIPPASSSLFLAEDDLSPSNQFEVSQIVPEMMLPSRSGTMILPEITLPLNTLQVNTAYSLLRTLRNLCCENTGVLDTTSALVQLPPVGDAQSPYQVPPPAPVWPVPQLPLRGLNKRTMQRMCIFTISSINASTALANASRKEVGHGHAAIQDITVGFGVDRPRLNVVCTEAPGMVVYTDPAAEDEGDLDSVLDVNYGAKTLDHNERIHYGDLKDRFRQRRDRTRQLVTQLSTLNTRNNLNPTEVRLLGKTLSKEDIRKYSQGRYPEV